MGYTSCITDPDVWMKPQTNKEGYKYWSYMLVYVDDCLALHHDPGPVMEELKSRYKLNNDTYGEPKRYLGANVEKYQVPLKEKTYWSMHAHDYVVESCRMVRGWSVNDDRKFKNNCEDAMYVKYCPEIDISAELGDDQATQSQQMIGTLRWSIELGRIDIITEVSLLLSFNVNPREGHLEAAYRVFEYLYAHKNGGRVVFDDCLPKVKEEQFKGEQFKEVN